MMLTREEIGDEQYNKGMNDRSRFHHAPALARSYARERGSLAATHLESFRRGLACGDRSETALHQFAQDAAMFARMAFKGWRAYRLMKGE